MDQPAAKTKPKISAAKSAGQSQPPKGTNTAKPRAAGAIGQSNSRMVSRTAG
jgi:hypothetical protein